ncbi:MAG: ABC transporter substrate-binding protein, partial [SAR324 cluster bacterium]|nr:ABC transporter substrate-binding protein [SAR324 cluster bacterium]
MKTRLIVFGGSVIFFSLLTLLWFSPELFKEKPPEPTGLPIKMARYYWPGYYWMEIADAKGWFKDAGLNIQLIDANPDYFASLNDVVAGKTDTSPFTLFDQIKFNLKGADLVMVLALDHSFGADGIIAKPSITEISKLKGQRIGVSRETYSEYILATVLKQESLSLKDVTLIDMPSEKTLEAFLSDKIDAFISWEPYLNQALEKGGIKLFDTSQIPGISPEGLVFHRAFIEKRRGDVDAIIKVWHRTTIFIQEHPDDAFGIIAS